MNIYNFTNPDHQNRWQSFDDWVMGGRSSSQMQFGEQGAHFTGRISLAKNGGFASIQSSMPSLDLSDYTGISLNVLGDGKTYGFILRDDSQTPLRYQASFKTKRDIWQTVYLPFDRFAPMAMCQALTVAPTLNRDKISAVGLIVSHQFGDFSLHVKTIEATPVNRPILMG